MTKTSQSYTIGNSTVTLRIGDIIDSQAKVIVSSDDDHLTMAGGVSKAIYEAGGDTIRQDAQKQAGRHDIGDVVITSAGNLHCDHVFHGISRRVQERPTSKTVDEAKATIGQIVRKSIALLVDMGLTSIAFPAIGTGFGAVSEGRIIDNADERPPASWLLHMLTVFKLRYVALLVIVLVTLVFAIWQCRT